MRNHPIRLCVWVIVIILLASSVLAQGVPFQTVASSDRTLSIAYPKFSYFEENQNFTLHFHVFNVNGTPVTNETASCYFHLYNSLGAHIQIIEPMLFNDTFDFEVVINTSIVSRNEHYAYIMQCNTSNNQGGFLSNSFSITHDGEEQRDLQPLILGLGLITFFLLLIAIKLDEKRHGFLKLLLGLVSLFIMFIIASSLIDYSVQGLTLFTIMLRIIQAVLIYIFVYLIYVSFSKAEAYRQKLLK